MQLTLALPLGETLDLGVPPDVAIDPGTAFALFAETTGPLPSDLALPDWADVRPLSTAVRLTRRLWQVECAVGARSGATFFEFSMPTVLGARVLRSWCSTCRREVCPHLAALLLALLHASPPERERLLRPAWFEPLAVLCAAPEVERRPASDRRAGWIRARLALPRRNLGDCEPSFELIRQSKRGDRLLKPRALPPGREAVEREIEGLTEGELRFLDAWQVYCDVQSSPYDYTGRLREALMRRRADLFARLGGLRDVRLDERPITVDPTPFRPTLVVRDGPDGGLAPIWRAVPQALFRVGPGYVIDPDDRLRPVADGVPFGAVEATLRPPPPVAAEHVPLFVERVVLGARTPVELESARVPVDDGLARPRLVLGADGPALIVALRFDYGPVEAGFDDPPILNAAHADPPRLIRRDAEVEQVAWQRLAAVAPEPPATPGPIRIEGEAAFDFLLDAPPALGWEVVAERGFDLHRWRPVGALSGEARLRSGIDWFDLEVRFEAGEHHATRAAVLESWRAGRRYVRLSNGALAWLPDAWLARHGETLAELESLRGRGDRLGAFAAPLAADLLDDLAAELSARRDAEAAEARRHAERWRAVAAKVRDFAGIPARALPPGVQATLRPYQHAGYRWMAALADLGLAGVLADDMGLGKTLQTLVTLLDGHRRPGPPSLVVAPTSVVHNWVEEAARFAPALRVALHHGPHRGEPPTDVDVVVTSFALLRIDALALQGVEWRWVVLDEAQAIKNPQSQLARAARGLRARHRLALTGTPLENHLVELWSLFEFLMPGFFGSKAAFGDRYARPAVGGDEAARREALDRLRRRIRPFVLRRLKAEVAAELPPRQEQILRCDLGPAERRLYESVKETYRDAVLARVDDVGLGRATIQVLEALTRLRQAACDPALLPFPEARGVTRSAKRALLRETLSALIEEGHRALVFSQWPSLLRRVVQDLDRLGVAHLYLDGSTRRRADLQARWNAPDGPPVFLISLKAGGTGLNLTGADVVIHLDPWWNPQVEQQATDRAHRIGQTKPVMVYKLVARGTVEEKVLELQARKRALFEAAVDGDRATVDALTRDDLAAVFAADADALADADERGEADGEAESEAPARRRAVKARASRSRR